MSALLNTVSLVVTGCVLAVMVNEIQLPATQDTAHADLALTVANTISVETMRKYQDLQTTKTNADKAKQLSTTWYNNQMWFVRPFNAQLYKQLVEYGEKKYTTGVTHQHQGNTQWIFGDGYKKAGHDNYALGKWAEATLYYNKSGAAYKESGDYYGVAQQYYREAESLYLSSMQTGK